LAVGDHVKLTKTLDFCLGSEESFRILKIGLKRQNRGQNQERQEGE